MRKTLFPIGTVLFLEPRKLLAHGATTTRLRDGADFGMHAFVCVDHVGARHAWCPIFSRNRSHRVALPVCGRSSHQEWLEYVAFINPAHIWLADLETTQASLAPSRRRTRWRIVPEALPQLRTGTPG